MGAVTVMQRQLNLQDPWVNSIAFVGGGGVEKMEAHQHKATLQTVSIGALQLTGIRRQGSRYRADPLLSQSFHVLESLQAHDSPSTMGLLSGPGTTLKAQCFMSLWTSGS